MAQRRCRRHRVQDEGRRGDRGARCPCPDASRQVQGAAGDDDGS